MANVTLPAKGTGGSTEPVIKTYTASGAEIQAVSLNNSAGTEIGTAAAPARVDPTGTTTQPVSAASLPLPTGAATSALQGAGLPAALAASGSLKTQPVDQYGWSADCTPNSELITTNKIRLVGEIFDGAVVDSNFWTKYESTGTVTQVNSELVLTSGTANGHYAVVQSVRRANWITGTINKFRSQMRIESSDDDITCRIGVGWGATMPTITDGAYFKIVGSTISACTMANGAETEVASANFNGTYSAPTLTNSNVFEIIYGLVKVHFIINNVVVHTATFSTSNWTSNTNRFYIGADVRNTGNSDAVKYIIKQMNICRLGTLLTAPAYKYISGAATTVCKLGAGILHKIIVNQAGTLCTIYDQTSGAVPIIGVLDTNKTTGTIGSVDYECPFFNGLTIVTTGAGTNLTVVYE